MKSSNFFKLQALPLQARRPSPLTPTRSLVATVQRQVLRCTNQLSHVPSPRRPTSFSSRLRPSRRLAFWKQHPSSPSLSKVHHILAARPPPLFFLPIPQRYVPTDSLPFFPGPGRLAPTQHKNSRVCPAAANLCARHQLVYPTRIHQSTTHHGSRNPDLQVGPRRRWRYRQGQSPIPSIASALIVDAFAQLRGRRPSRLRASS